MKTLKLSTSKKKKILYDFIKNHKIAVLSTVTPDKKPEMDSLF